MSLEKMDLPCMRIEVCIKLFPKDEDGRIHESKGILTNNPRAYLYWAIFGLI